MRIKTVFKIMIAFSALLSTGLVQAAFFGERSQGWHWYQDPICERCQEPEPSAGEALSERTPTEQIKAYRQELEKKLHAALVDPTPAHVKAYQEIQKDLMDRSARFSEVWMQVVYQNPSLDHSLQFPVNHQGRHLYLDLEKKQLHQNIQALKEEYGLFFFFDKDCPYCHAFAPIVKQFSESYGWQVLAISPDGSALEGFETVMDNGLIQQWKVEAFPALFAVHPRTQQVLQLSYGLSALAQIEQRLKLLLEAQHPGGPL